MVATRAARWLALTMLCVIGAYGSAHAAAQECRDVDNVTICADSVATFPDADVLFNNVRIGPKGQANVLAVDDVPARQAEGGVNTDGEVGQVLLFKNPHPNFGKARAVGKLRFATAAPTDVLIADQEIVAPSAPTGNVVAGFIVDTVNRKVVLPPANSGAYVGIAGKTRGDFYVYHFNALGQLGQFLYGPNSEQLRAQLNRIEAAVDLNTKIFTATVPFAISNDLDPDNANFEITARVQFNEQMAFSGGVDAFKMKMLGMTASVSGITLRKGEFEAGTVDINKIDNPDLPNFDPSNQNLVFRLSKLLYKDKKFSIAGGAVPINNWVFGDAFRMTNQTIGLLNDAATNTRFFQINSTLNFGEIAKDSKTYPVTMKVTRKVVNGVAKPAFEAGISQMNPKLGVLQANLTNVLLVADSIDNFYGIKAQTVALQWPPHLGGRTAAGVQDFRLGVDRDKKVKFSMGGGQVSLPEFESKALKGSLAGTVSAISNTVQFTLTGNLAVNLPRNSGASTTANMIIRAGKGVCPAEDPNAPTALPPLLSPVKGGAPQAPSCQKPYEQNLSAFGFKLVGFTFVMSNPKGLADGGFAADAAQVALPLNASGSLGFGVSGLRVRGAGDIEFSGGELSFPPIVISGKQFVGLKGGFFRMPDGGYELRAGGTFPLPGLEPGGNGPGIGALVTFRNNPNADTIGGGVALTYTAAPGTGIVIGNTGMELTGVSGGFDVNGSTAQILLGMRATSLLRIPPPVNLPIVTFNANATTQINPFAFNANANVSLLIFEVANTQLGVGPGNGFNGGGGVVLTSTVNFPLVEGQVKVRAGRNNATGKNSVAANASASILVRKDSFIGLPNSDIRVAGLDMRGGQFVDSETSQNVLGLKATFTLIGSRSVFLNLGERVDNSPRLTFRNSDRFELIPAAVLRARAADGVRGYSTRALPRSQARAAGMSLVDDGALADDSALVTQDIVPINVPRATQLVAGVRYTGTAQIPALRLVLPNGTELTQATATGASRRFEQNSGDGRTTAAFVLDDAAPGDYRLIIDNAPAGYEHVAELLNRAPVVSATIACSGVAVPGVQVQCGGPSQVNPGTIRVNYTASDADSPDATVSIGLIAVDDANTPIDYARISMLRTGLPAGAGGFDWTPDQVTSGRYRLVVLVDDGKNPEAFAAAPTIVTIVDQRAPSAPSGLGFVPQASEVLVRWEQNGEADLAGYEIGFGIVDDGRPDTPENFVYTRLMGPKEIVTGTNNIVDGKLWGLDDDVAMYYSVRAYDQAGNYSAWAPMQVGKPWALAPSMFTPAPNAAAVNRGTRIALAFSTPLVPESIAASLEVVDAAGQAVAGEFDYIIDESGARVTGVSFNPASPLQANTEYTARLKSGVRALDGRQTPGDVVWRFSTGDAGVTRLLLPIIGRQ
jgi:hypothetical protein